MRKIYVLDTNIILHDPKSILGFEDREVVIPIAVVEELDNKKTIQGEVGYHAREAGRILKAIREKGNLYEGIKTEKGGRISVQDYDPELMEEAMCRGSLNLTKYDNLILLTALTVAAKSTDAKVILVTNDTYMQIKADGISQMVDGKIKLYPEYYRNDRLQAADFHYKGRRVVFLLSDEPVFRGVLLPNVPAEEVAFEKLPEEAKKDFVTNEFIEFVHPNGEKELGMYREGKIRNICLSVRRIFDVTPRNTGQFFALYALMAPVEEIPLVILRGNAGTAKTFLSLAAGLEQTLETKVYNRILYTRANVEFDRDIGSLPGTEQEKMGPLVRPCQDNLESLFSTRNLDSDISYKDNTRLPSIMDELMDQDILRIESMSFMRGRTIGHTFVIVDEAQNCTIGQVKGIVTRPEAGTKIVLAGDESQIDNRFVDRYTNGLSHAAKKFKGSLLAAQIVFSEEECTRSALAAEAAKRM